MAGKENKLRDKNIQGSWMTKYGYGENSLRCDTMMPVVNLQLGGAVVDCRSVETRVGEGPEDGKESDKDLK